VGRGGSECSWKVEIRSKREHKKKEKKKSGKRKGGQKGRFKVGRAALSQVTASHECQGNGNPGLRGTVGPRQKWAQVEVAGPERESTNQQGEEKESPCENRDGKGQEKVGGGGPKVFHHRLNQRVQVGLVKDTPGARGLV